MPDIPLTRKSISGEFSSVTGLGDALAKPADQASQVEEIDDSIPLPKNITKVEENIVEAPDGSKTVEITLTWDDSGDSYEYEIQIGDIET